MKSTEFKDFNGESIVLGSVLQGVERDTRGVVVEIASEERVGTLMNLAKDMGDIAIESGPGSFTITNCHREFVTVPKAEQTYRERFLSWHISSQPHEMDGDVEWLIEGLMAVLPDLPASITDHDDWYPPNTPPDAVSYVVTVLEQMTEKPETVVRIKKRFSVTCSWTDIGFDTHNLWEPACTPTTAFELTTGNPFENGMKNCPYCGKNITLN